MTVNPWYCWIGPYNAHCFKNDKGNYLNEDHTCAFCGDKEPGTMTTDEAHAEFVARLAEALHDPMCHHELDYKECEVKAVRVAATSPILDMLGALARVRRLAELWPEGENSNEPYGDPAGYYLGTARKQILKALEDL